MNVSSVISAQFAQTHQILGGIMADVDDATAHRQLPGSTVGTIASIYAHLVLDEDFIVSGMVQGKAPLHATGGWAAKSGVESPGSPIQNPEWAAKVRLTPAFNDYAQAVYAATDAYLAAASDGELARVVETPLGKQPVTSALGLAIYHHAQHSGEIAALKGVFGQKGLPF